MHIKYITSRANIEINIRAWFSGDVQIAIQRVSLNPLTDQHKLVFYAKFFFHNFTLPCVQQFLFDKFFCDKFYLKK